MRIPKGLSPDLIGKVVIFQAFQREKAGSDNLKRDTLSKYVGTLQMYYADNTGFVFKLEGDEPRTCDYETHYVELHTHKPEYLIG